LWPPTVVCTTVSPPVATNRPPYVPIGPAAGSNVTVAVASPPAGTVTSVRSARNMPAGVGAPVLSHVSSASVSVTSAGPELR
jgi:hypothetical protein